VNLLCFYLGLLQVYGGFPAVGLVLFLINAPHGRFNDSNDAHRREAPIGLVRRIWNSLNVDGTIAWIVMELPSPFTLFWTYNSVSPITSPTHYGPRLLVGIYLIHYVNRALISPLRTTSRSPSHVIVVLAGIAFNIVNGSLMGTYLGSIAKAFGNTSVQLPFGFWIGVLGALAGLASNIWHDEVLLRLRKNPSGGDAKRQNHKVKAPRYSVPYGGLYRFISYVGINRSYSHVCIPANTFTV
jgi:3-oxo-5-alpha-steroid 4-dehydrogenase 1